MTTTVSNLLSKARIRWLRERETMMKMMNMYIISSWKENLKEDRDGMGDGVRWFGSWDVYGV